MWSPTSGHLCINHKKLLLLLLFLLFFTVFLFLRTKWYTMYNVFQHIKSETLWPRPHVSGDFWKRIFFPSVFKNTCPHVAYSNRFRPSMRKQVASVFKNLHFLVRFRKDAFLVTVSPIRVDGKPHRRKKTPFLNKNRYEWTGPEFLGYKVFGLHLVRDVSETTRRRNDRSPL